MYCCIRSCPSRYGKASVSFHRFPQHNAVRRRLWIEAAGRGNEINYLYAVVCSRHFVGGRPAKASDSSSVSWVPTLLLDKDLSDVDAMAQRQMRRSAGVVDGSAILDDEDIEVNCAVRGCGMSKEENPSLLFFSVPRNQNERRKWLLQIGMPDDAINANLNTVLAVCELHFDLTKDLLNYDDVISMGRTAMLKENVMPSRNVPAIYGHNPAPYTHDMPDVNMMAEDAPLEEDDGLSLLEEMPERNGREHHEMSEYSYMQPSPIEEFVQICRSCLSTDKTNLVSAFDDRLAEIFQQFTSVSINENEGISTMICVDCKSRLLEIHFFRDTCLTNTQILLHRYQKCYGMAPNSSQLYQSHHESMDSHNTSNIADAIPSASTSGNYNHYDMSTDDPEDLLVPQKEEKEAASQRSTAKPRGRPPKAAPATPPKPVIVQKTRKAQKIAIMKKRFKCKFCRKEYNSRPGFEMHMATHKHHQQSEFTQECTRCDILTRKGDVHRCYRDILYCYVCGEKYGKWGHLKLHLAKVHRIKTKRRELMQKLKEIGYVDGARVNVLKVPPSRHTQQAEESDDDDDDDYNPPTQFEAEKSDSSRSATNSPAEQQQQRKCTFCGVGFLYNSSLEMHMKTHSTIELTQCNECDLEFDSYLSLERHHDEHDDENPLQEEIICRFCGKQINRQQTLLLHYQYVHKDKHVVQCSTCPQLFENAIELTSHTCRGSARQGVASSSKGATNGDFVIIRPESILKRASNNSNSLPVGLQDTDGADPLLGLGNEEVIDLDSGDDEEDDDDDEDYDDKDESSQEKSSYDCTICNKQFLKEDILDRHMKLHRMMNAAKANDVGLRKAMNCRREVSQPI